MDHVLWKAQLTKNLIEIPVWRSRRRTNVVGLTLTSRSRQILGQSGEYIIWLRPTLSELSFSEDNIGGKFLVHVLMDSSKGWESDNRI